jgi:hypothetical protein
LRNLREILKADEITGRPLWRFSGKPSKGTEPPSSLRKRGKNARGAIEDVFSIVPGKPSSMDVEG